MADGDRPVADRGRHGRLQARMSRHIVFVVVVTLFVGMASTVGYRHFSMRRALEESARRFASLSSVPLTQMIDMYDGASTNSPVDEVVGRLLELNQDVEGIDVVRMNGSVAFSVTRERVIARPAIAAWPTVGDLELMDPAAEDGSRAGRIRVDGRAFYRVFVPPRDIGESSSLSVVATFTYENLNRELRRALVFAALALGLGLVIAHRISVVLARDITRNLDRLRGGVRRLRAGHLDKRVDIRSGDEIEELADAFNDMSDELEQSVDRLRRANLELLTLDQMKADLVANVSHELRTPLTAVKGYLELLDGGELGELTDEVRRAVAVCKRNADRLALRVEDLVQMSQIEKAWPEFFGRESIDVGAMIATVTETFEMRVREKELTVDLEVSDDLPPVAGNPERIERVILNLVDNAVKFTPDQGSIKVTAEECDHEGRHGVLVRCIDSGIGIPSNELVRIFDRFHQVDQSIRRRYGGMGLGLSLVQRIVEAHRGVVWAESSVGHGSTFCVWLPCRASDEDDG